MRTIAYWLSLVLIFTIPWENLIAFGGLGTVSRVIGYLVAMFWAATVLVTGRFRQLRLYHGAVYLFVLWNVASVFWSVNTDKTVTRFVTGLQLVVLIFMLWDLYVTPAMLKAGLQAYVLGGFVSVNSTIANYLSGNQFYPERYGATGFNVNDLAFILALGIPVAWHLAVSQGGGKKTLPLRLINYAYIPAAVVAILLTASRTALLATFPAFLYMLSTLAQVKLYIRVMIVVALVGSLFAVLPFVPQASFTRLGTTSSEATGGDLNGRMEIWRDGFASFQENPLLGIGSGAYAEITDTGKVGHNFVISLLVEVGIVGFFMFMAILAIVGRHAWRQPKWWSRLWLAVLAIWLLGAATHNLEYRKQTWLFLSMVVVSASMPERREDAAAAQPVHAVAGAGAAAAGVPRAAFAARPGAAAPPDRLRVPGRASIGTRR